MCRLITKIIIVIFIYLPYGYSQGNLSDEKFILKVNLPAVAIRSYQIQSEYLFTKKVSLALSIRYMSNGTFPFAEGISSLLGNSFTLNFQNLAVDAYSISPEVRYYFGNKEGGRGFYVGTLFSIERYRGIYSDLKVDFDFDEGNQFYQKQLDVKGKMYPLTGGFYFGNQWRLSKRIYLDWWILGVSYGRSSGYLSADVTLNEKEQAFVLDNAHYDLYPIISFTPRVQKDVIYGDVESFWTGLRTGLCLGISIY
jgi:hypothetical protein